MCLEEMPFLFSAFPALCAMPSSPLPPASSLSCEKRSLFHWGHIRYELVTLCSLPSALCSLPFTLCPMRFAHSLCAMLYALCSMRIVLFTFGRFLSPVKEGAMFTLPVENAAERCPACPARPVKCLWGII